MKTPTHAPQTSSVRAAAKSAPSAKLAPGRCVHQLLQSATLHRSADGDARALNPTADAEVENAIADGGRPLSQSERKFFEPRFGHNFSRVRIHDDARAHAAADSVRARAFTLGNHIVMNRGEYAQGTPGGRRLLAHELAHTVQQGMQVEPAPVIQRFEAAMHERAESRGLTHGPGGLSADEASEVYMGNWTRDFNQFLVPSAAGILGHHNVIYALLNLLLVKKFGRTASPDSIGYYVPSEHIDNPAAQVAGQDMEARPPAGSPARGVSLPDELKVSDMTRAQDRTGAQDTVGSGINANLFGVDQTGVMAYIRRSNLLIEDHLMHAARKGRNSDGFFHFGAALHAVEDLFAHSNWVEIALEHTLKTNPTLRDSVGSGSSEVFSFARRTNSGRRILTTGTFSSLDTAHSITSEVVKILRNGLDPNVSETEVRAQYALIRALLLHTPAVRSRLSPQSIDRTLKFLESAEVALLPITNWVREQIYPAINAVLAQLGDSIESQFTGAAPVSETSLPEVRDRTGALDTSPEKRAAIDALPEEVRAGPSHTQISKDHSNSVFFGIAFRLATEAVKRLRVRMVEAWATGTPSVETNEAPPGSLRAEPGFRNRRREEVRNRAHEGRQIETRGFSPEHGMERPSAAMMSRMRTQQSEALQSISVVLNAILSNPSSVKDTAYRQILREPIATGPFLGQFVALHLALQSGNTAPAAPAALNEAVLVLRESAIPGVSTAESYDDRAGANAFVRRAGTNVSYAAQQETNETVKNNLQALQAVLNSVNALTSVSYTERQRRAGQGASRLRNVHVRLPDLNTNYMERIPAAQRAAVAELLQESRHIVTHPLDVPQGQAPWWKSIVEDFITSNTEQIRTEIAARNAGYSSYTGRPHRH